MRTTAHELRATAEHADGLRGRPLRLFFRETPIDGDRRRGLIVVDEGDSVDTDRDLDIVVETGATNDRSMQKPVSVAVQYTHNTEPRNVQDCLDSMFWTQSAVEKFLFPYYVRILSAADFKVLRDASQDPNVHALGHRPPTVWEPDLVCDDLDPSGPHELVGDGTLTLLVSERSEAPLSIISFEEYLDRRRRR